jgi:hypothetical protein
MNDGPTALMAGDVVIWCRDGALSNVSSASFSTMASVRSAWPNAGRGGRRAKRRRWRENGYAGRMAAC